MHLTCWKSCGVASSHVSDNPQSPTDKETHKNYGSLACICDNLRKLNCATEEISGSNIPVNGNYTIWKQDTLYQNREQIPLAHECSPWHSRVLENLPARFDARAVVHKMGKGCKYQTQLLS